MQDPREHATPARAGDYARSLLGRQVRVEFPDDDGVLLLNENDVNAVAEGQLLGFGDGGDVEILQDDGFIHYCWPMLKIEHRRNHDD